MPTPTRADALALMQDWTPSQSLRKHMLSVECAMRAYAEKTGADVEAYGIAGLIHDFDYERYPNDAHSADQEHPAEGVRHLRSLGWPEEILDAVMGHAHYTNVLRESAMSKTLFAVDELTGLITACALVKPSKAVADVDVAGVKKKMKDKAFARGVNRDDVIQGAEALGVPLDEHIGVVLAAMQANAEALGLGGVSPSAPPGTAGAASTGASLDA